MVSEDEQHDRLFDHILGHQATEIAAIGLRSGLFAVIGERPGSTDVELASAAGLDTQSVSVWARQCVRGDPDASGGRYLEQEHHTRSSVRSHDVR